MARIFLTLAITLATLTTYNTAHAGDVKPVPPKTTTVRASNGKLLLCTQVTRTLTVCVAK
jgi:hypothetical protein